MVARSCLLGALLLPFAVGCGRVGYELTHLTEQRAGTGPGTGGVLTKLDAGPEGGLGGGVDGAVVVSADAGIDEDSAIPADAGAAGPMDAGSDATLPDAAVCEVTDPTDSGVFDDSTCDGNDDDCDTAVDEDYPVVTVCGLGACVATSTPSSCMQGVETACVPGPALALDDRTLDGVDDDCDGEIDEDSCESTLVDYALGSYSLTAPPGCNAVVVKLWGGGGGASDSDDGTPGGAGGYVQSTLSISGALDLFVGGGGGGSVCRAAGQNPGGSTYHGGAGGEGVPTLSNPGAPGEDGAVDGGGLGGADSGGGEGGRGHYGGGGGAAGASAAWPPYATNAGGGGAASVMLMGGSLVVSAGGGGGAGSPSGVGSVPVGPPLGGTGGDGCAGPGGDSAGGGGGGGGGVCIGAVIVQGTAGVPAMAALLPGGEARGGAGGNCRAGGDGYAQVVFVRQ